MSEEREPYECMNEGEPHAAMDWLARVITLLMLAIIILVVSACPAQAANNWCAEWASGYEIGYCWARKRCDYIPPEMCPYPEEGETDGYMRGLNDGLSNGKKEAAE